MIYLDIDGVCVDFVGTAKKFGVELEHNRFDMWKWCDKECHNWATTPHRCCPRPTPEQFYAVAELQPWFDKLLDIFHNKNEKFLTKDYASIKTGWLILNGYGCTDVAIEAPNKSVHCQHPTDLLIDDNAAECQRWRDKGGIAYHFDLADPDPFGKFLAWWRLGR